MGYDRRRLLRAAGATAAASTVGIAGCLGDGDDTDDGGGSQVPYRNWLATDDDGDLFVAYFDRAGLEAAGAASTNSTAGETRNRIERTGRFMTHEDPLLDAPLRGLHLALSGFFGTVGTGLGQFIDLEGDGSADADGTVETSVDELFWVNGAYVMAGDVEPDEVHERLTAESEDDLGPKTTYERTGAIGEFARYEPAGDGQSDPTRDDAIAVGEDAIVVSLAREGDPVDAIRGPIEAYGGEAPRAVDRHDDLDWLVETAGDGHLAFGVYGDLDGDDIPVDGADDEYGDLAGSTAFVGSWRTDGESESTAALAALFDDLDAETEADLEARLGSTAADANVAFDGDRVTATGTWDEGALVGTNATGD